MRPGADEVRLHMSLFGTAENFTTLGKSQQEERIVSHKKVYV